METIHYVLFHLKTIICNGIFLLRNLIGERLNHKKKSILNQSRCGICNTIEIWTLIGLKTENLSLIKLQISDFL